jgi:hypothetical protein
MSVEAIAYVKSLDLGEHEKKARLLMYVIGENTFNDTFNCVVGIEHGLRHIAITGRHRPASGLAEAERRAARMLAARRSLDSVL